MRKVCPSWKEECVLVALEVQMVSPHEEVSHNYKLVVACFEGLMVSFHWESWVVGIRIQLAPKE